MGTTRMAASPRKGVVNADGRLHAVDNLYVASSSVFPTGGWANPTLTIVALSLRLADHLAAVLKAERSGSGFVCHGPQAVDRHQGHSDKNASLLGR